MKANEVAENIKQFLKDHEGITIHPGRTSEKWSELVVKEGGCPCVPGRNRCPCDEALEDIKRLNHCRCYLFVNDEYLKIYEEVVVKKKKTKGAKADHPVAPPPQDEKPESEVFHPQEPKPQPEPGLEIQLE